MDTIDARAAAYDQAAASRAIWALTAGTFVVALNLTVLTPLLPDVSRAFGATPGTLGLLSAMYAVPQAVGAPLLGPLADRWGRRPLLLAALLGYGLSAIAAALAPSLVWLAASNYLIRLLSLGFLSAVTEARSMRYIVDRLSCDGAITWSQIGQNPDALLKRGEGLAEAFDVDAF